jgi:hypothetical protein
MVTRAYPTIRRTTVTGAANTIANLSTWSGQRSRVLYVLTKYSGAPTQAGVTATLNSGAGAAYDTLLNTGAANAQNNLYAPAFDLVLEADDTLDISAPAGGVGVTASILIIEEVYN